MSEVEFYGAVVAGLGAIAALIKLMRSFWRWFRPRFGAFLWRVSGLSELERTVIECDAVHEELITGIRSLLAELRPNGGQSIRDVVNRIENHQIRLDERSKAIMQENSVVAIFETDEIGQCIWVNRKYQRVAGRSLDEVRGYGWVNSIHPDDRAMVEQEWERCVKEKRQFSMNYRMITPDGKISYVKCVSHRMSNGRDTLGYIGMITVQTACASGECK